MIKANEEPGNPHVGRIYSSTGTELASVVFKVSTSHSCSKQSAKFRTESKSFACNRISSVGEYSGKPRLSPPHFRYVVLCHGFTGNLGIWSSRPPALFTDACPPRVNHTGDCRVHLRRYDRLRNQRSSDQGQLRTNADPRRPDGASNRRHGGPARRFPR